MRARGCVIVPTSPLGSAGTSHDVGKQDLKPAKLIIRAQKRAAAAKSKAGAASGSQKRKHEVVIDEEDE